jgi:hypothetical protein
VEGSQPVKKRGGFHDNGKPPLQKEIEPVERKCISIFIFITTASKRRFIIYLINNILTLAALINPGLSSILWEMNIKKS